MRNQWPRRIVPRWRSSMVSASLSDSSPLRQKAKPLTSENEGELIEDVTNRMNAWAQSPSLGVAADLLNFSHVPELKDLLRGPAEFVMNNKEALSPQLCLLANTVLGTSSYPLELIHSPRVEIARLRQQLQLNPRDSLALIDMARIYAISGQNKQAGRAVRIAVSLQPDNRFILRSAARFFLHDGDPDHALGILKKSSRTQDDPWLLASMIAIETIKDKPPQFFKRAKIMIENRRFLPIHIAELSGALATVHLNNGEVKFAKKMFNSSLGNPNDNAVAQAVWAANEFSIPINIQQEWLTGRFSSEANYYTNERLADYSAALGAAMEWFDDEPFSSRPLKAGTFAAAILGEYQIAENLSRKSLQLDAEDGETKNNLVFSLASQDKLDESIKLINEIIHAEGKDEKGISGHTLANLGLISYRSGDSEMGRKFYERAQLLLTRTRQNSALALALAFWAHEATKASDPELDSIIKKVTDIVSKGESAAAKIVLQKTLSLVVQVPKEKVIFRPAVSWEHDRINNILISSTKEPFRVN